MAQGFLRTLLCTALIAAGAQVTPAQEFDAAATAYEARKTIAKGLDAETLALLTLIAENDTTAEGAEAFGHALLMSRHLEPGGYMFALSAERDPERAAALSNLGVVAAERSAGGAPGALPPETVTALQRAALALSPDNPDIAYNLAGALMALEGDAALAEAVPLLRTLHTDYPGDTRYASRLASALELTGASAEADALMAETYMADSASPYVHMSQARYFGGAPVSTNAEMCSVDFGCAEICPGGIIGQIQRVTCEMESSGAQASCMAGEPFATGYDCDVEIPKYGIMIPGLFPGFSVLTPFGSLDVIVQGGGRIEYRAKVNSPALGPVQAFLDSQGSYQPSIGAMQWDVGGGVQYAIFSRGPLMDEINTYDLGPSGVVRYGSDQDRFESRIDAGRGIVVTN